MFRTTLVALASLAIGCAGSARADEISFNSSGISPQYYYETSGATPADPGVPASHLSFGPTHDVGGLCVPGSGALCPKLLASESPQGPLANAGGSNQIEFTTPDTSRGTHFLLILNVGQSDITAPDFGHIYDVTLTDTFKNNTIPTYLGHTSVVGLFDTVNGPSFNSFSTVIGGGTYTIGITDLLQEFVTADNSALDTLPGDLGDPALNSQPPNFVGSLFDSDLLSVDLILTNVPEPAGIAVLAAGMLGLAAVRRRGA